MSEAAKLIKQGSREKLRKDMHKQVDEFIDNINNSHYGDLTFKIKDCRLVEVNDLKKRKLD